MRGSASSLYASCSSELVMDRMRLTAVHLDLSARCSLSSASLCWCRLFLILCRLLIRPARLVGPGWSLEDLVDAACCLLALVLCSSYAALESHVLFCCSYRVPCTCALATWGSTKYRLQLYVGMLGLAKGRARRPMICSNVQVDSEYSCSLYVHILVL